MGVPSTSSAPRPQIAKPERRQPRSRTGAAAIRSRLTWGLSLALFAVPLVLLLFTIFNASRAGATQTVALTVSDLYTEAAIAGAQVTTADGTFTTEADGAAALQIGEAPVAVTVTAPGYGKVAGDIDRAAGVAQAISLRPTTIAGTLTDSASGAPVSGVTVSLASETGTLAQVVTGEDGAYQFDAVPANASLTMESPTYGVTEQAVAAQRLDVALTRSLVTGRVNDESGAPLAGATVSLPDGTTSAATDANGQFSLNGVGGATELLVRAPGYTDQVLPVPDTFEVAATLEPVRIRAIYANFGTLAEPERLNELIEIADTTEVNAIVIDVKQDTIYYDTQVPFFRSIPGMVTPIMDVAQLNQQLHDKGIYTIARMVVFKDPVVAEGRPDLSVGDDVTGDLWRDMNGSAWVNAFNEELWAANADLAVELAGLGFDEIQYDYIRFPSDGDLRTADFGRDYTEEARRAAITGAVKLAHERLLPTGAKFSLDLFPIIALFNNDQGIGQTLEDLTPYADYVSLMIYPSHFELGNIPVDGHPNDFPAETVTYTLEKAEEIVPGTKLKMRPWLQDFDYPLEGYSSYGPAEVREQIDAAEEFGTSGWLLWNAAGEYQVEALEPED